MHEQRERHELFNAFKSILKQRRISYKDLAEKTEMAESTIKRIFSLEECSLSKLLDIAKAADLSLQDLVTISEKKSVEASSFSLEAETFLAKNLDHFYFYRKLFFFKTVASLKEKCHLSTSQIHKYLKKLDALNIIEWLPNDKIRFLQPSFLQFRSDGPLKFAVYRDWTPNFHERVLAHMGDGDHFMYVFSGQASDAARSEFLIELQQLAKEFLKRAAFEQKIQPKLVRPVGFSFSSGPYRVGLELK